MPLIDAAIFASFCRLLLFCLPLAASQREKAARSVISYSYFSLRRRLIAAICYATLYCHAMFRLLPPASATPECGMRYCRRTPRLRATLLPLIHAMPRYFIVAISYDAFT